MGPRFDVCDRCGHSRVTRQLFLTLATWTNITIDICEPCAKEIYGQLWRWLDGDFERGWLYPPLIPDEPVRVANMPSTEGR